MSWNAYSYSCTLFVAKNGEWQTFLESASPKEQSRKLIGLFLGEELKTQVARNTFIASTSRHL